MDIRQIPNPDERVEILHSPPAPVVSVVIPSSDGSRGGNVSRIIEAIKSQTIDAEIILVTGARPNGRPRNLGARAARGRFLVFIDDYTIITQDDLLERLIRVFEEDSSVGLAGASKSLPPDTSWWTRYLASQSVRTYTPVVREVEDSDMVTHTCMAVRRDLYLDMGGECETIIRGTDTDLRDRVRKRGLRVVLAPGCLNHKPQPRGLSSLMANEFRRGLAFPFLYIHRPDLLIPTPEYPDDGLGLKPVRRSVPGYILHYLLGISHAIVTLRPVRALLRATWLAAFLLGLIPPVRRAYARRFGLEEVRPVDAPG